jgi:hypothetical protein
LITGGGDEELVLDVDEVLTVSDDLAVGVLNRVLKELSVGLLYIEYVTYLSSDQVVAPFGRAACDLAIHATTLGAVFRVRLLLAIVLLAILIKFALHLLAKMSASTMSEQSTLALFFTTKSALTLFFTFESTLLHWSLLSSAACLR